MNIRNYAIFHRMAIKRSLMLVCLASLVLQAGCNEDKVPLQITGIVYDAKTNQPIDKAYVIAIYSRARGTFGGHSSSYCYMARGMYTGPDGKFALPVTNLDHGSPAEVNAIKADYYFHRRIFPENIDPKRKSTEFFSNRHIYLMPQDPVKPNIYYSPGDDTCADAQLKSDREPLVPYITALISELEKYGDKSSQMIIDRIGSYEGILRRIQDMPIAEASAKVGGKH